MPSKSFEFHPEARQELNAAHQWYAEQSEKAAQEFAQGLAHALEKISQSPETWPVYEDNIRFYVLHRFPYIVFYEELANSVVVFAVAHSKRKPNYWRKRPPS